MVSSLGPCPGSLAEEWASMFYKRPASALVAHCKTVASAGIHHITSQCFVYLLISPFSSLSMLWAYNISETKASPSLDPCFVLCFPENLGWDYCKWICVTHIKQTFPSLHVHWLVGCKSTDHLFWSSIGSPLPRICFWQKLFLLMSSLTENGD